MPAMTGARFGTDIPARCRGFDLAVAPFAPRAQPLITPIHNRQDRKSNRFQFFPKLTYRSKSQSVNPQVSRRLDIDFAIIHEQRFPGRNSEPPQSMLINRSVWLDQANFR